MFDRSVGCRSRCQTSQGPTLNFDGKRRQIAQICFASSGAPLSPRGSGIDRIDVRKIRTIVPVYWHTLPVLGPKISICLNIYMFVRIILYLGHGKIMLASLNVQDEALKLKRCAAQYYSESRSEERTTAFWILSMWIYMYILLQGWRIPRETWLPSRWRLDPELLLVLHARSQDSSQGQGNKTRVVGFFLIDNPLTGCAHQFLTRLNEKLTWTSPHERHEGAAWFQLLCMVPLRSRRPPLRL